MKHDFASNPSLRASNANTADGDPIPSRGPSRAKAASQGREAIAIIEAGGYASPSLARARVDLAPSLSRASAAVRDYGPEEAVPLPAPGTRKTTFAVVNETSLTAARALVARRRAEADPLLERVEPLVLNFASAKNPGGGFLGGARAQEESLARSSTLYAVIAPSPMYPHHRDGRDAMYTRWMIHTPHVAVFRDDASGDLLPDPYEVTFLTAPAPNAGVVLERDPSRRDEVRTVMAERITRVLAIAAAHGHRDLVLGAWGCGVFKNEPAHVAACFARELRGGPFDGAFDHVVFAILDWSPERRFIGPFAEAFA